jgi:hypothetical protein
MTRRTSASYPGPTDCSEPTFLAKFRAYQQIYLADADTARLFVPPEVELLRFFGLSLQTIRCPTSPAVLCVSGIRSETLHHFKIMAHKPRSDGQGTTRMNLGAEVTFLVLEGSAIKTCG